MTLRLTGAMSGVVVGRNRSWSLALTRWVKGGLLPGLCTLGVLAVWEAIARAQVVPQAALPPLTRIILAMWELLQQVVWWSNFQDTLIAWAIGLTLATLAGVSLGVIIGSSRRIHQSTAFVVEGLRPIPAIAILPVLILVVGTGLELKVMIVTLAAFWPILVQTMAGVQDVDPVLHDTARIYRFGKRRLFVQVVIPSAMPYIATSLRLAATLALLVSVGTELVVGGTGIGVMIASAHNAGREVLMWALICLTGILGISISAIFVKIERTTLHWHATQRKERPA